MTFKIEKDVPLSPRYRHGNYPYRDMQVGDSFFVPDKAPRHISHSYTRAGYALGFKFSARKVDGGCRVWRIK